MGFPEGLASVCTTGVHWESVVVEVVGGEQCWDSVEKHSWGRV